VKRSRWFEAADLEVSACRRFVRSSLEDWGDAGSDVVLLASELATNAVVHARSRFLVVVDRCDDCVRVEVSDDDTRPLAVPEVDQDSFSGRGLAMVVALADAWGVDHRPQEGKTVWFEVATGQETRTAT
jgi:anti-sigma regulatory factor (Ser/Thr protein kinase)